MDDQRADTAGQFSLQMQKLLLQHSIAAWPRRGRTLLEINCGGGDFLPLLWECGFDMTATESNPDMRADAGRMADRAEVLAATDDHLPFDDGEFDWVVLHLVSAGGQSARTAMAEALRVAAWRPRLLAETDQRPLVSRITQPVRLLHGSEDKLMPVAAAEWLAEHLPNATLLTFPDAAHAPFLHDPARCAAVISRFACSEP